MYVPSFQTGLSIPLAFGRSKEQRPPATNLSQTSGIDTMNQAGLVVV